MEVIKRKRLEKRILYLLGEIQFKKLESHDIGFITFTGCQLSKDGSYTKIFVSVYENEKDVKKIMLSLKKKSNFIRRIIAKNIRMKNIPRIEFILDNSLEKIEHIENLFNAS